MTQINGFLQADWLIYHQGRRFMELRSSGRGAPEQLWRNIPTVGKMN